MICRCYPFRAPGSRHSGADTVIASGAKQSMSRLRQFANTVPLPRRAFRASFSEKSRPLQSEGAGNAGRPMRPQPRVQCVGSAHECSHHGHTGKTPGIPRAMVLTVSFVLSPVIGLVCHRRWQIIANLTPASRRQDHTTSPSAAAPFVCVSQAEDPITPMLPRPPHPAPRL